MTKINKMYKILEDMLNATEKNMPKKVFELNNSFDKLAPQVYHNPPTKLNTLYDNCRQSCIIAETMPTMRKKFIEDAKKRWSMIPKPKE